MSQSNEKTQNIWTYCEWPLIVAIGFEFFLFIYFLLPEWNESCVVDNFFFLIKSAYGAFQLWMYLFIYLHTTYKLCGGHQISSNWNLVFGYSYYQNSNLYCMIAAVHSIHVAQNSLSNEENSLRQRKVWGSRTSYSASDSQPARNTNCVSRVAVSQLQHQQRQMTSSDLAQHKISSYTFSLAHGISIKTRQTADEQTRESPVKEKHQIGFSLISS